jgi:hypothetical protein
MSVDNTARTPAAAARYSREAGTPASWPIAVVFSAHTDRRVRVETPESSAKPCQAQYLCPTVA